jgi:hypothetical protein
VGREETVLPADLPEIDIPYRTVEDRYGNQAASISTKLTLSAASETIKNTPISQGRWAIAWRYADPPATRDYDKYLEHLRKTTEVYLVIRLARRWKAHEQLADIPEKVMAKLEEQARLRCSASSPAPAQPRSANRPNRTPGKCTLNKRATFSAMCVECHREWTMSQGLNESPIPEVIYCPWCGTSYDTNASLGKS